VYEVCDLSRLKLRAVRCGVWFRALKRIDRVLLDLTLRVCDAVRGRALAKSLRAVVAKLEMALENRVSHIVETVGFQLAARMGLVGLRLGNVSARDWGSDVSFARFLGVMYFNSRPEFRPQVRLSMGTVRI
jgi:hypothetical protein